jgi:hypothetical protein
VLVNPDIYPLGETSALHEFYFFADKTCRNCIGTIKTGEVITVLSTEFRYYKAVKAQITKVYHDYNRVGYRVGDIFHIFLWWGDNIWLVNYKGKTTYIPCNPDFISKKVEPGVYDGQNEIAGVILDNQEDKTALFKIRTRSGRVGWIKYETRGLYDGIYNHFKF